MTTGKNTAPPPAGSTFWELFDYFWAHGLGNDLHSDGTPVPWTASALELAFDGTPDKRSIENWQSRNNMPSPDNIRRLSWVISAGDDDLRKAWYNALIEARLEEKRREKASSPAIEPGMADAPVEVETSGRNARNRIIALAALCLGAAVALGSWLFTSQPSEPMVSNIRICDQHYFDDETKDCTQHVSVFVHGIDEVFLSFDFGEDVPVAAPFERWWIRNGERVAGRTSFNDEAWPGYTFWRPGILPVGQYVVRIVVDEQVFTQTFFVQPEGFTDNS